MEVVSEMVDTVPVLWFDGEGNGPEEPVMSIIAMTTAAGAKVGMDTEYGGFFMVPEHARKLACALIDAAERSEALVREQVS